MCLALLALIVDFPLYFYFNLKKIGLFQRAIGESGSVLAEWALDRNGRGKEASLKIAEMSGCPVEPYEDLLTCVRNVDAEIITRAYQDYSVRFQTFYYNLLIWLSRKWHKR